MKTRRSLVPTLAIVVSFACTLEDPSSSGGVTGATAGTSASASASDSGLSSSSSSSSSSVSAGEASGDASGSASSGGTGDTTAGPGDPGSGGVEPTTTGTTDTTGGAPDGTTDGATDGGSSGGEATSTGEPDPNDTTGMDGGQRTPGTPTDPELLVAMVGDQGSGSDTKAVYKLIKDEGADLLIILGDFDYNDDPDDWATEMEGALGPDFPVFGVIGNHDVGAWKGYQAKLQARLEKIQGATCTGDLGVKTSCNYRGLHFILSGIGTKGKDDDHVEFLAETLAADQSLWSVCAWHKNHRDLQAGDKPSDVPWAAFQACQDAGAIIAMGHEHSYARTRTLTKLGTKSEGHGAIGDPGSLEVAPGRTFSVVSGLGGKSIRGYEAKLHQDDTWWGTIYTSDYYLHNGEEVDNFDADNGAFFVRFHVDGDPTRAVGYFKNTQGDLIDDFEIVRK